MSNDTWIQIRVTKAFKEMLKRITSKRGMSKFVIDAIYEKIGRDK